MKNVNLILFFSLICASSGVLAQIPGSVSFGTENKVEVVQEILKEQTEQAETSDIDASELLAKRMKKQRIWDNPRFSKKVYASLKGRQEAIERVQNEEMENKKFASEEEKQKFLDDMKSRALIHFDDYKEAPEEVHLKMNENPRDSVVDMSRRLSYASRDKMNSENTDKIQKELQDNFMKEYGVSTDEYREAFLKQLEDDYNQRQEEKDKAESFPPISKDKQVKVEKLDDQNALLHIRVGAPVSKKKQ